MQRPRASTWRSRSSSTLIAVIVVLGCALFVSTSYAAYLNALGPAECCRSHCHRGHATSGADADRCCATHLSVLPAGLGPAGSDVQHGLVAVAFTPAVQRLALALVPDAPPLTVTGRASPPGSLLSAHTALLI